MHTLFLACLSVLQASPEAVSPNVFVRDARSGQGIPGVEVLGVAEVEAPVWGEMWSTRSTRTDSKGQAFLPPSTETDQYFWRIVRAEGYAVSGSMEVPKDDYAVEVDLWPSIPARLSLVDFQGKPLSLVHLGLCVGCGHTPDVFSCVTDAQGKATIHGVGCQESRDIVDVYPVGEHVRTEYLDVEWDAAQADGYRALASPGVALLGRLLQASGKPAVGFAVGVNEIHRGPWAITGEDGRFTLFGLEPGQTMGLTVKDPAGRSMAMFEGARAGMERQLVLSSEEWGEERGADLSALSLLVTTGDAAVDAEFAVDVPLEIWDTQTGWSTILNVPMPELTQIELPPGSFEIELGGKGSPFAARRLNVIDVEPGMKPEERRVQLPVPPITRLEISLSQNEQDVSLFTSFGLDHSFQFDRVVEQDGQWLGIIERFPVPAGPFTLWAESFVPDRSHIQLELDRTGPVWRTLP